MKRLAIDYNKIYRKAMEDYIATLVTGGQHAVTASFVLPSLIEQGLGMVLQNRMLFKCIMQLNNLTEEEKKKLPRTLGRLLNSNFAKEEIRPEYLELLKNFFVELNIRNCIMRGLGETFDYLDIGLVAIMFQMLWDIVECEIFKD